MSEDLPLVPPFSGEFLHNYGHSHLVNRAHFASQFLFGPALLDLLNYHPSHFKTQRGKYLRTRLNEDMLHSEFPYGVTEPK
jgi:hypothetical protein